MGNFTKLGNTAGVIFTAMWAWTERPEVIKSHAWRIRGFTRWSPAEIGIYPTPLRHRAIRQVRMSFCVLVSFSFFTASAAGGQIENKMMIKVHFFYPTEAKMRHDADETQISQHTQVMGRQAGPAKMLVLLHISQTHTTGLHKTKSTPPNMSVIHFCCLSHW